VAAGDHRLPLPRSRRRTYATGVIAGAGVILDDRYYEVVFGQESGEAELVVEELGKPATVKNARQARSGLLRGRIAGSGSTIVAMCQRYADIQENPEGPSDDSYGGSGSFFVFTRSDDGGKTWKTEDSKLPSANRTDIRLWVAPGGTVIVKGACAPRTQDGCDGHGVIRPAGSKEWTRSRSTARERASTAVVFAHRRAGIRRGHRRDAEGGHLPQCHLARRAARASPA